MPMLMDPFTANPFQALESHKLSAQRKDFSSCPVVELFIHKTTRAQLWSVLQIISCGNKMICYTIKMIAKLMMNELIIIKYHPAGSYVNP